MSAGSPQGEWDRTPEKMMGEFGESRRAVFHATSPLTRGQLKSKGGGKLSKHCRADLETIETVFAQWSPQTSSVFTEQSRFLRMDSIS